MRWVIEYSPGADQWVVRCIEGIHSRVVAYFLTEADAMRILTLLNRHGMVDVPLEGIEET